MNDKTKNYLGWALIVSVLAAGLASLLYVSAYRRSIEPLARSFMVTGEGRSIAIPDIARVNFSVLTEGGSDLAALQTQNTAKVNQATAFLKQQGIDAADIQTESYNVSPRYQNFNCERIGGVCPAPTIVGYTIEQAVALKIRDFSLIGPILSGVVQNGANRVWGFNFAVDDRSQYEGEARAEALAKAKAKAQAVAKASGFTLGPLLSIDEGFYPIYKGLEAGVADGYGGAGGSPLPAIEPGSSEIVVSVNLRYAIK